MNEQGCSELSVDLNGRILDRLAGLEKIISSELVAKALGDADKQNKRACTLTHEVMIWVVLGMGLFTELPIRQVFKASRRLRRGENSPARSRAGSRESTSIPRRRKLSTKAEISSTPSSRARSARNPCPT